MAFLALAISAFLSLSGSEESEDPQISFLLARGWQWVDPAPCEGLSTGKFYEIESENESKEFYAAGPEKFLAPGEQWPEPPAICREIPKPSFIQEVK